MPGRTPEGDALTALVLPVFTLNGEILEAAATITALHELTPARWQVLGAVLDESLPVAEIARRVGLTRQSVQRVANDVVAQDWAHWQPNPGRRGQNLLVLTPKGRQAVAALAKEQHAWANTVGQEIGEKDLKILGTLISRLTDASRCYPPERRRSGGRQQSAPTRTRRSSGAEELRVSKSAAKGLQYLLPRPREPQNRAVSLC